MSMTGDRTDAVARELAQATQSIGELGDADENWRAATRLDELVKQALEDTARMRAAVPCGFTKTKG